MPGGRSSSVFAETVRSLRESIQLLLQGGDRGIRQAGPDQAFGIRAAVPPFAERREHAGMDVARQRPDVLLDLAGIDLGGPPIFAAGPRTRRPGRTRTNG